MKNKPNPTAAVALKPGDSVHQFCQLALAIAESLQEAADMLARLVANDPGVFAKIRQQEPSIPPSFLNDLLRVGERSLHPSLLYNACPAYRWLRHQPYSTQLQLLEAGTVSIVIDAESGDHIVVPLMELSPLQLKQVFADDGVRTRDEQRAWLRRVAAEGAEPVKVDGPPYVIRRDRITFTRACDISVKELSRILAEAT